MKRKNSSVELNGMNPGMWSCAVLVDEVYRSVLEFEITITSGCEVEAVHGTNSYHYKENTIDGLGRAIDIRTWDSETSGVQLSGSDREELYQKVKHAAGKGFQVVNEKDHFHIEMDG